MAELHIISENDELSDRNGSAVLTVAKGLSSAAKSVGRTAWIGGGRDRLAGLQEAIGILDVRTGLFGKPHIRVSRVFDSACKYFLGLSLLAPRILDKGLTGVENIYLHNQPWLAQRTRRRFPNAKLHLYVHNKIFIGAPAVTIRRALRRFDSVICVSDFISTELQGRAAFKTEAKVPPFRTLFNAVDASRFTEDDSYVPRVDVVYVGRVVEDKGVHVLVRSMAKLAEDWNCSLRIVGGAGFLPHGEISPYEMQVLDELRSSSIRHEVTGPVPPGDVPALINSAKIMVIPSIWDEPCGLVLLEGLASKAAVVASNVGGMPEVGPQSGAKFVTANNVDELADTISELLTDDDQRRMLAITGRRWSESRNWSSVYSNLLGKS